MTEKKTLKLANRPKQEGKALGTHLGAFVHEHGASSPKRATGVSKAGKGRSTVKRKTAKKVTLKGKKGSLTVTKKRSVTASKAIKRKSTAAKKSHSTATKKRSPAKRSVAAKKGAVKRAVTKRVAAKKKTSAAH